MQLLLPGKKAAILAADGFNEHQMTEIQRALVKAKAEIKTVAPESAVVNGWQGDGWGHHFHVDAPIGETLGSDFDFLIIPGGSRAADKLRPNPHTRRIINHFIDADKPIVAIEEGVTLLALAADIGGRKIAALADPLRGELTTSAAVFGTEGQERDENLLTSDGKDLTLWVESAIALFAEAAEVKVAA